jgi:hypothetical protein
MKARFGRIPVLPEATLVGALSARKRKYAGLGLNTPGGGWPVSFFLAAAASPALEAAIDKQVYPGHERGGRT